MDIGFWEDVVAYFTGLGFTAIMSFSAVANELIGSQMNALGRGKKL
jgi:hypothetical protein